jgi:hypothetical protein
VKRATRHLLIGATLLFAASACAEGDAESVPETSPVTTSAAPVAGPDSTAASATSVPDDFGSRYNGAPVAFWFWAPY